MVERKMEEPAERDGALMKWMTQVELRIAFFQLLARLLAYLSPPRENPQDVFVCCQMNLLIPEKHPS